MNKSHHATNAFSHQRLDVYKVALRYAGWVDRLNKRFPKGRASLRDQLTRATESIVLNIAEGAQQQTGPMSKRHYRIALASAAEAAAALDLLDTYGINGLADGQALIQRVGAMLRKMAR